MKRLGHVLGLCLLAMPASARAAAPTVDNRQALAGDTSTGEEASSEGPASSASRTQRVALISTLLLRGH